MSDLPALKQRRENPPFREWMGSVPDDKIGVDDGAVFGGPRRQTVIARGLVHEFAGRIALIGAEGRHPKLMLNEAGPPSRWAVGMGERTHGRTRLEPVSGRCANPEAALAIFEN